jgi:hypothetical protein
MLVVLLVVLAAALAPLARPLVAGAQEIVRLSVQVLLASDTGPEPAGRPPEELEQLIPKLRQLFRYKHYQVVHRYRGQAPIGGVQRWAIPGDRTLEVSPEGVTGNAARLQLRLQRGSVVEVTTSMQAAPGAPAVIGGPRHGDGVLIVVVRTIP